MKVARIFNTYRPRMHPNDGRVVSNSIVQALAGREITLFGDGSETRAFCYADGLVEGFVRLMVTGDEVTGPMNLGNPQELSNAELAREVVRPMGAGSSVVFRPLPQDDPAQWCPDIGLARAVLGWGPMVGLEVGLGRTIEYSGAACRVRAGCPAMHEWKPHRDATRSMAWRAGG